MKKKILAILALAAVCLCPSLWAVDIANASSGAVVPGEWNTNFAAAKSYAEQNKTPLLILWSNPGCAQCNKMKTACNTDTFVAWRKAKKIVLVISEADASSKSFAKNASGKFPYMRLYWPAGGVDERFSGRSTLEPLKNFAGSTLEAKFINYLDTRLRNWIPGGGSAVIDEPEEEEDNTPGPEWNKARRLYGSITAPDGTLFGRLIVSAGKINAKKGVAKVKVQVMTLAGKTKTLGSKEFKVGKATTGKVSGGSGSAEITITGSELSGSVYVSATSCLVSTRKTGGALKDGARYFFVDLDDFPSSIQGNALVNGTDYIPDPQMFMSANSKWSFGRKGVLRYDRNSGMFAMSTLENPSGLKLTYSPSTGYFKGSFTVYTVRKGSSTRKYTATVGGFMIGDEGTGVVTVRNAGVYGCSILVDIPADDVDDDAQ